MHPLFLIRLGRIKWRIRTLGIVRNAAFVRESLVVVRTIPIAAPFPDIAGHVVRTVAIRRKRFHRRDAGVSIFNRVFHWKFSMGAAVNGQGSHEMTSEERRVGKEWRCEWRWE